MDQAPGFKKLFNNKNNKSNDVYEELGEAKNANSLAICEPHVDSQKLEK